MEEVKESDLGDVGRFLNRLLGLKILSQNMVSYIEICMVCLYFMYFACCVVHLIVVIGKGSVAVYHVRVYHF